MAIITLLVTAAAAWQPQLSPAQIASANRAISERPTIVVIDANNVRGATAFRISNARLLSLASSWAARRGLSDSVVCCWDHGQAVDGVSYDGVEHMFAGPRQSADDVIANTLPSWLATGKRACVVTTDRGLIYRVKAAARDAGVPHGNLKLCGTRKFVALLLHGEERSGGEPGSAEEADAAADTVDEGDAHLGLCAEFERGEAALRAFTASMRPKRRHERLRKKLRRLDGYNAPNAEKTWHRVLLTEKLRRLLLVSGQGGEGATAEVEAAAASDDEVADDDGDRLDGVRLILNDVRLDAKQRNLILRYGAALSEGRLQRGSSITEGGQGEAPAGEQENRPRGEALPLTRRERRRTARSRRPSRSSRAAGAAGAAAAEQLGALEEWLRV